MMEQENNIGVVVLAAGRGTRFGCKDKPKVMLDLGGKPVVAYGITLLEQLGFSAQQLMMVVGFCQHVVRSYFGRRVLYAEQTQQRGTAHAVFVGAQAFDDTVDTILVMQGDDCAFLEPQTISSFIEQHTQSGAAFTLFTVQSHDASLGRVLRDANGALLDVLEKEELTREQQDISERNTNMFLASREWILKTFPTLTTIPGLNEYGIPEYVSAARKQGLHMETFSPEDPSEFFGINNPEQLEAARRRKQLQS